MSDGIDMMDTFDDEPVCDCMADTESPEQVDPEDIRDAERRRRLSKLTDGRSDRPDFVDTGEDEDVCEEMEREADEQRSNSERQWTSPNLPTAEEVDQVIEDRLRFVMHLDLDAQARAMRADLWYRGWLPLAHQPEPHDQGIDVDVLFEEDDLVLGGDTDHEQPLVQPGQWAGTEEDEPNDDENLPPTLEELARDLMTRQQTLRAAGAHLVYISDAQKQAVDLNISARFDLRKAKQALLARIAQETEV